jgi:hypothetical protein
MSAGSTRADPNLTLTWVQCSATVGKEQKTLFLCGICRSLQRPATTDRTLVMSRGKRFESARRLSRNQLR